jgi:hypothetical protein
MRNSIDRDELVAPTDRWVDNRLRSILVSMVIPATARWDPGRDRRAVCVEIG